MTTYSEQNMNMLAQYFYEEVLKEASIKVIMPMGAKPELVAALTRAAKRVQEARTKEFEDSTRQIAEQWATVVAAVGEAFSNAARLVDEANATPKADRWETKQTHEDCEHCEAAVEEAIERAKYTIGMRKSDWVEYSIIQPGATHVGQARRAN